MSQPRTDTNSPRDLTSPDGATWLPDTTLPLEIVLRNVRFPGGTELFDVVIGHGTIIAIAPAGELPTPAGSDVVDAEGRFIIPGLWDEHTHMVQWALAMSRLDLSAVTSAEQAAALVAQSEPDGALVGYGFRDAFWPDSPTRAALDVAGRGRPVVLVSGDLHCAWVNTSGAALLGVNVDADGIVREGEWFEAMGNLDAATDTEAEGALTKAIPMLAERGVVGVVDLEWSDNVTAWRNRIAAGQDQLRVKAGVYPDRLEQALADGLRTGELIEGTGGLLRMGPLKILSDGSLNTRTAYCSHPYELPGSMDDGGPDASGGYGHQEFDAAQMLELVRTGWAGGIHSTIHAIGDLAVTLALDTFEAAGVPGRIEHAQMVSADDDARFAAMKVVASVQPEHAMDDRDLVEAYWPDRADRCFPLASLQQAGATLRLGSDAPVAPLDPWIAMSAAVSRSRDGREPWQAQEAIDAPTALAASARGRERVAQGDVADLVLVDADPYAVDPAIVLRKMPVWATMLGGRWTFAPA